MCRGDGFGCAIQVYSVLPFFFFLIPLVSARGVLCIRPICEVCTLFPFLSTLNSSVELFGGSQVSFLLSVKGNGELVDADSFPNVFCFGLVLFMSRDTVHDLVESLGRKGRLAKTGT